MDKIRERRHMERQPCEAEVDLSYFNKENHWNGWLLNINRKGGYLETARPMSPRRAILIRVLSCTDFAVEHTRGLCSNAVAEVKWCRKLIRRGKSHYGVGLSYYFPR